MKPIETNGIYAVNHLELEDKNTQSVKSSALTTPVKKKCSYRNVIVNV